MPQGRRRADGRDTLRRACGSERNERGASCSPAPGAERTAGGCPAHQPFCAKVELYLQRREALRRADITPRAGEELAGDRVARGGVAQDWCEREAARLAAGEQAR